MKILKIILWISAIGCLSGFINVIMPWPLITKWMLFTGVEPIGNDPASKYMFRLGFMAYGMIGLFFIILAKNPIKYSTMLPLAACFLIGYGLLRLTFGIIYQFPVWHYIGDFIVSIAFGASIFVLRSRALNNAEV